MATRKPWDHGSKNRHARGYGKEHDRIRAELLRTVVICEECKRQDRITVGTIADHIIPLAAGGTGDRSNYQLLCVDCDRAKLAADNGKVTHARKPTIGEDGWPIE